MASDKHTTDGEAELSNESERAARRPSGRPVKQGDRRHAAPEEDPIQVLGGRLLIGAAILASMVFIPMWSVGNPFQPKAEPVAGPKVWTIGQETTVAVTVITAD